MDWLKQFNSDYANAVQAITPIVLGVIPWVYFRLYKESKLNEGDAASIVRPVFWTIRDKFKILAVHKYEASNDISGFAHVSQNSRTDQWQELIEIRKSILGLRHEIVPRNEKNILDVIISRDGTEKWKVIPFNK
ncbi:MAG: hypothetical protein D4S02_15210 [Rhodocyclaceae bacterium]|nr:MAG: hypothetical protein D4S02_15210 [Rhodocyclaceae bacterium]